MGSDAPSTLLGVVIAVLGLVGSVLVARISRPKEHDEPAAARVLPPARSELTTIAGLAQEMVRLQARVTELESEQSAQRERSRQQDRTIAALRRYTRLLEMALRATGAPVPDPDPRDAPLIRVP